MLVLFLLFIVNSGVFIRNCWIRRKRLNQRWAVGLNSGISKSEFGRLLITVLSVLLIYWPLALYRFALFFKQARLLPYRWEIVHGPLWKLIIFENYPRSHGLGGLEFISLLRRLHLSDLQETQDEHMNNVSS